MSTMVQNLINLLGIYFVCLFDFPLYIPVNSYGHIGTLPSLYGHSTQHLDVMTSKNLRFICMDAFPGQAQIF